MENQKKLIKLYEEAKNAYEAYLDVLGQIAILIEKEVEEEISEEDPRT